MSNRKIVKNMVMLFGRTLFNLGLSLYISRKLLEILGESDFGIYSVVGGIAVMFSFLQSAFFSSAQRFLALTINNGVDEYRKCFATCLNTYLSLALVILILSETIGVYFVNHILNIPQERLVAANWVFQFAVFSVILSLTNGPYRASIIVYERLDYFAKIDVIVKILQLLIVIGLSFSSGDNLVFYAMGVFLLSALRFVVDKLFCIKKLAGCNYVYHLNKSQFYALLSFSGWTIFKSGSESGVNQGNNVLINIYGGTIASASMGLASQIWVAVAGLVNNIHLAFTTQIIQNWGTKSRMEFFRLINDSMRYSLYILIIIGIPFITHTQFFLKIWLVTVPEYAISFCRLSFISCILYSLITPLNTGVQAVGRIKKFHLIGSVILILDLPLAFIFLSLHFPLYSVLISRIIFQGCLLIYNSLYLHKDTRFPVKKYLFTICKIATFGLVSIAVTLYIYLYINCGYLINIFISTLMGIVTALILFWFLSLYPNERERIFAFFKNKLK